MFSISKIVNDRLPILYRLNTRVVTHAHIFCSKELIFVDFRYD